MKAPKIILTALGLACLLLTVPERAVLAGQRIPPELTGRWTGDGEIIVTWCQQRRMPFDLTIDAAGNVSGTVGDAVLKNASLNRRTRLMTRLGNGDWIIQATLDGSLVAAEGIRREKIWLMLTLKEQQLEGGLNTSGWHIGGKKTMFLSVRRIVLKRSAA
ncbi:MAG: hypothetical protein U0Z53_10465 [Blastocatellia bacterium]